ncbi:MAG: FAD-dependent oxidoreductase [Candidatus Paceibacterota bacterium]|jgi:flavin-dependent dehydrogenase|nr:FAD-dependent oxidoreductase [Candidatus Paceibacterota bacterium]MDD4875260.1 FAD-dependent oxidoreductase [Candidatus Paceibacterota bacterium]
MSNSLKIAIVGAGVIGLYLAWQLSLKGHKVFVYEKRSEKDFGDKPCSTLVSERIRDFIPIEENTIENKIIGCLINFPEKTVRLDFRPIHLALSRAGLTAILLEKAKSAGAEVFFEKEIKGIPQGFDKIIGCDGGLSHIRQALKLPMPRFRLGLQLFERQEDDYNLAETWPVNSGFIWRIARGREVEWGILADKEKALPEFRKFLAEKNIDFIADQLGQPIGLKSAIVPQGMVLPEEKNITLCGDAAGMVKPWSGGGLIWGLKAACILLETFPNFEAYHKKTSRFFAFRIAKGRLADFVVHFLGQKAPFVLPSRIVYDNDFPIL